MASINKSVVGLAFSDESQLNLVAQDLEEGMISLSFEGDPINRGNGAMQSVKTYNFYRVATITANILKTSTKIPDYMEQIKNNASLNGTLTVFFDNGLKMVVKNLDLNQSDYTNDGVEVGATFTIRGDVDTNIGAIL